MTTPDMPLPDGALPAPRRLDVPTLEHLLRTYHAAEGFCRRILALEIAGVLAFIAWLVLHGPASIPWPAWVAAGIGGLGVFRFIPRSYFLNKKRLSEIRPDAQLGVHTRDSLLKLSDRVFTRLGLPPSAAPVFLIREKDVNAHAIRCELWPGVRAFNGVFLNRGLLHLLDEDELACVVGHELGHVFPYAPLLSRTYLVHALFAAAISVTVTTFFPNSGVAVMVPLATLWLIDRMVALPHLRHSRGIEFLCDDYGVRAGGLLPALSGEMKLGAENETRQGLLLRALEARSQGVQVALKELFEAYETAVPFGRADPSAFEREFGRVLDRKRSASGSISLGGFLESLSGGESEDAVASVAETMAHLRAIQSLPTLQIDRQAYLHGASAWTHLQAGELIRAIRFDPHRVLFRLAEEWDDRGSTHPSPSRRMLFLHDQHTEDRCLP